MGRKIGKKPAAPINKVSRNDRGKDFNEVVPENESEFHQSRRVAPYALRQFYFMPGKKNSTKANA